MTDAELNEAARKAIGVSVYVPYWSPIRPSSSPIDLTVRPFDPTWDGRDASKVLDWLRACLPAESWDDATLCINRAGFNLCLPGEEFPSGRPDMYEKNWKREVCLAAVRLAEQLGQQKERRSWSDRRISFNRRGLDRRR